MKLLKVGLASSALVLAAVAFGAYATSAANTFNGQLFEFVGTAAQCAPGPAGTDTIEAAWMTHEGLPDAGKSNHALFLEKVGLTSNCAAPGVHFRGVEGMPADGIAFWIRSGSWCGAGAPRFNLTTEAGTFHFVGCAAMTSGPILVDPQGNTWTKKTMNNATASPPVLPGQTIQDLEIVFDEGTDVGPGFAWLDDVTVGGFVWGKPGNAR